MQQVGPARRNRVCSVVLCVAVCTRAASRSAIRPMNYPIIRPASLHLFPDVSFSLSPFLLHDLVVSFNVGVYLEMVVQSFLCVEHLSAIIALVHDMICFSFVLTLTVCPRRAGIRSEVVVTAILGRRQMD